MILRRATLCLVLLLSGVSYSQHYIFLYPKEVYLKLDNYYVSNVVDARAEKNELGITHTGMANNREKVYFKKGIGYEFLKYIRFAVDMDTNSKPIILVVEELKISEKINFSNETATALLKMSFLIEQDNGYVKIFETTQTVEETKSDATATHESRIRQVIHLCLQKFMSSEVRVDTGELYTNPHFQFTGVTIEEITKHNYEHVARYNSHLNYFQTFGLNSRGWGIMYMGYMYEPSKKWFVPFILAFDRLEIDLDPSSIVNFQGASLFYIQPGVSFIRYLGRNFFINLAIQVPLGRETIAYTYGGWIQNFIIGLAPSQGIWFTPKKKFGVDLGITCFQKILTSQIYPRDFGVQFHAGFKF
jgi:hypothetical protein